MQPIDKLINTEESAWPMLQSKISEATNTVEVLPATADDARTALHEIQVTTRSPMGTLVYETGGLLVDHGWLRILGSGSATMQRSLMAWNKGKTFDTEGEMPQQLIIADDAIGGYFYLNGGSLGEDTGKVYYLDPTTLDFQPLGVTYTEFLNFAFHGDLFDFYDGLRWSGWETEVSSLGGDQTIVMVPALHSDDNVAVEERVRKVMSADEVFALTLDARERRGGEGATH